MHTWNPKKKKLMFHFSPATQYLLMTVMLMEEAQYARTDIAGLFVICEAEVGKPPN